jgi:hypothetical protein
MLSRKSVTFAPYLIQSGSKELFVIGLDIGIASKILSEEEYSAI